MPDRIVLVDGHALAYRAFHALPPLTTPQGEVVNAVYGFLSMLVKACGDLQPRYLAAAFDVSSKTFRREEYEAYKGTRQPSPEGFSTQLGHIYRLLEAMRVPLYRLDGYEADDLLGTLAVRAADLGLEVVILTGDLDALQLVGPHVSVLSSRRGFSDTVLYDEAAVRQRYGLAPAQLIDYKALRGDASDNIPGVPGIGEKTASKLLEKYGTVENLYEHLAELPEKQRAILEPYRSQVAQSRRLVTIVCDLPLDLDLQAAALDNFDAAALRSLLYEFGFRSLVDRLPAVLGGGKQASPVENGQLSLFGSSAKTAPSADNRPDPIASTVPEVEQLARAAQEAGGFSLVVEGTTREPMRADVVGLAVAADALPAHYVPLNHAEGPRFESADGRPLGAVGALLEDPSLPKYLHNAKAQMLMLSREGLELQGLAFDAMIAAYLIESTQRSFELRDLAWDRLQEELQPLASLLGTGRSAITLRDVPVDRAAAYVGREAELLCRLVPILERELRERDQERLFREVELPLIHVLADLELTGVAVDVPYLHELSRELYQRLVELEAEIYRQVGHEFKVTSPRQLSDVLFDELKLPRSRKTSTGQGSTGADVLESLRGAHPVVELIIEHRQLQKLKSTYVDALPLLVNPSTGRVHTSFNQTSVATGRLSSSEPNLQNIPIRTELGRRVRRAFVPAEGFLLLGADYSQIELRILAHETQDPYLLEAFREGRDIHAATAAEVMGVSLEQVTPDMRRFAKVVNFGVLYGMSEFGLASRADLPAAEAAGFIQRYFERFATVREYQDRIIRDAQRKGYAETFLGRRRYFPDLKSSIYNVRQAAIRAAINHPIQGAASDIMKIAMIRVHEYLRQRGLRTRMILQVHDELVFEAPDDEIPALVHDLQSIMTNVLDLRVPLEVEFKSGPNWEEMASLKHARVA